jgi:type I restriction enzyme S subunit
MKEFLAGHDAGGSRQAITKAHLEGVPILLPPQDVLNAFATSTDPWFELVEANTRESHTLAALRGALLPKLLSGEVRLTQAGKAVETAL